MENKQTSLFNQNNFRIKRKSRILPLDIIYTLDNFKDASILLAFCSGWQIGIRSSCNREGIKLSDSVDNEAIWRWRFEITFIDNAYENYNHQHHLSVVKRFTPKYATVMDIMTKEQCAKDNIVYHPLEEILDWAEELSQYAQNVIVIPKYDCLSRIPTKFMLGYSVPTSHGGTPLPVSIFKDWRVHLLGGSWKNQLAILHELEDSVVSIDNNHVHKIAQYAQYYLPDGETGSVGDVAPAVNNPLYVALALSFGNVAAKVKELYSVE